MTNNGHINIDASNLQEYFVPRWKCHWDDWHLLGDLFFLFFSPPPKEQSPSLRDSAWKAVMDRTVVWQRFLALHITEKEGSQCGFCLLTRCFFNLVCLVFRRCVVWRVNLSWRRTLIASLPGASSGCQVKHQFLTFLLTKCTCLAPTGIRGFFGRWVGLGYFLPAYICEQGIWTCYTEFEYGTCTMRCWQMMRNVELSEERKNLNAQRIKQNTFKKCFFIIWTAWKNGQVFAVDSFFKHDS